MADWLRINKRFLVLVALISLIGSFVTVATWRAPMTLDPQAYPQQRDGIVGPCAEYWLGTMQGGHDLASYLGIAAMRTLALAVTVAMMTMTTAFLVGGLWALSRREPRRSVLAVAVLMCLGPTPLLMTVAVLYCFPDPGSWTALVVSMGGVAWAPLAFRLRNEVGRTLDEPFIKEARRNGVGDLRLLWEEIFPVLRPVIEAVTVLGGVGAVAAEATIGYLAGKALNNPSLGVLLDRSADAFRNATVTDGLRLLASSAVMMTSIVVAFRLWAGWRQDIRLSRATASLKPEDQEITKHKDGFRVSVRLRRINTDIVKEVFIPLIPETILVVAGGSGSGKSVACTAITGRLDVELRGRCIPVGTARGKRVMMLPQGLQEVFAQHLPIDRYFSSLGINADEALALLRDLGLEPKAVVNERGEWKSGKELSGGEAQRVALCLIVQSILRQGSAKSPDVLILDEGVSALDVNSADQVGKLLRRAMLHAPQLAVIVVNHRPDWTARWADHVVFLGNGQLLWSGRRDELFGADIPNGAPKAVIEYRKAVELLQTPPAALAHSKNIAVEVVGLTAGYEGRQILEGVELKVHGGEALVVTGQSGRGKTTLLKAIWGQDVKLKTSGIVRLLGSESYTLSHEDRRLIRYAVQNPAESLNPAVTVETILSRTVKRQRLAKGKSATRQLITEACQKASLNVEALNKTPAELNGGARIRAGLARTFLGRPRILFLDEPTAGLDPETAIVVLDQLRGFLAAGGSIIAVMHDADHIQYLGGRCLALG